MYGMWIILWHCDPAYDIGDDPWERRKNRGQKPQNPDQGHIHIEIPGYPGTDAGDLGSLVRTA
jgi:hypothetical protein